MALYLIACFLHPIAIGLVARPDSGALLVVHHCQGQGPGAVVGPLKQTGGAQVLKREGKRENVRRGHQKEERRRRREGENEEGKELVIDTYLTGRGHACHSGDSFRLEDRWWRGVEEGERGGEFRRRKVQGVRDRGGDGVGDVAAGG